MPKTNQEIVRELLADPTNPEVVNRLVSPDAVYVSLCYDDPELHKLMPWAGTHQDGQAAILKTFQDVHTFWTIEAFDIQQLFGEGEHVAVFGSFTPRSTKLDKAVTSPFAVLARVRDGRITYMQYMEDTFATSSTFRSGGTWRFQSDPEGGEVEV